MQARRGEGEPTDLDPGQQGTWTQLYRVSANMMRGLPAKETAYHFFGDQRAFAHCTFFVCYDESGILDSVIIQDPKDRHFHLTELPEELTGRAVKLPSVRLVFRNEQERENFLRNLPQAAQDVLAEPPRLVDIGVAPYENR